MKSDGVDGRKTAEVEAFSPKDVVSLQLTRRPSVKTVIQTQLTEIPVVQILLLLLTVQISGVAPLTSTC